MVSIRNTHFNMKKHCTLLTECDPSVSFRAIMQNNGDNGSPPSHENATIFNDLLTVYHIKFDKMCNENTMYLM